MLEAHHTTHIEGTHLTLSQAERLMAGEEVPEADQNDIRELLNYRRAFDFVSEYLNSGGPITEGLIREIHKRLVQGVRGGKASPGKYRKVQNYVVSSTTGETIYTPPPAHDVPILMAEMVAWLNRKKDIHPVLVIGIAQFQLVHIHPFMDGNGRSSRLLSTLCLYREGYDFKRLFTISEFYDRERSAFYSAIQAVRDQGMDTTGWLEYYIEGLSIQMREVTQRGRQAIKRDVVIQKHNLNDRQIKAVDYLLGNDKLTINEYEKLCPEVNRRTLQRDMKILLSKSIILEVGAGATDPTRKYKLAKL